MATLLVARHPLYPTVWGEPSQKFPVSSPQSTHGNDVGVPDGSAELTWRWERWVAIVEASGCYVCRFESMEV